MTIKPRLGYFDLTMIIVSLVIGIGIFRTPAIVAGKAGTPEIFFAAWIIGGVVSIFGALTFAEIGARLPAAGGFYKIFSHCYHPVYAFMLNWSLVIINSASSAGVALVGAEYITPVLLPSTMQSDRYVKLVAVISILVLFLLNYLGIKMGSRTQNVLSILKIALILLFCFAVFGNANAVVQTLPSISSAVNPLQALGVALIAVFFTYGGYQNTINFGADIKDAQKNIPRSIFTGMGIVIGLYLLINYAYFHVLGFEGVKNSKLLAAELGKNIFGDYGYSITCVVIFISVLGFINTSFLSNPRVYYAMADENILPAVFKKVNHQTDVQEFALTFFVMLMILSLFLLGSIEKIINYVMFIDSLALVSAAGTIFIFRKRNKIFSGFRLKLYPLVPVVFILFLFVVTINVVISDFNAALYGFIIFAAGFPFYHLMKKIISPNP